MKISNLIAMVTGRQLLRGQQLRSAASNELEVAEKRLPSADESRLNFILSHPLLFQDQLFSQEEQPEFKNTNLKVTRWETWSVMVVFVVVLHNAA